MSTLGSTQAPLEAVAASAPVVSGRSEPRRTLLVRVTHWITTLCFVALLVSGAEIVVSSNAATPVTALP